MSVAEPPVGAATKPTDFKKRTGKVGKRAPQAISTTSLKYSSKRVNMPAQQSVMKDRDESAPTASHGRDLPTLLSAAAHYAPHVRSEAVTGLAELASAHPKLVSANLRALCKAAAERFNDPDDEPRAAGRALAAALAAQVAGNSSSAGNISTMVVTRHCGETALQPFEPLLVAHLGSALTSLDRAVRLDGLLLVTQLLGEDPVSAEAVTAATLSTPAGTTSAADTSSLTNFRRLNLGDPKGWLRPLLPSLVEVLRSTGAGLRDASQGLGALGASGRVMLQVAAMGHKGKPSSASKASGLVLSSGSATGHRGALARLTALRALVSLLSATTPLASSSEQAEDVMRTTTASPSAAASEAPVRLFRRAAPSFTARMTLQAISPGAAPVSQSENAAGAADVSSSAASAAATHAAAVLAARGGIAHRGSLAASDAGALWEPLVASLQAAWTEATSAAANKHGGGGSTAQGAALSLTAQSLAECALVARAAQLVVEHLGRDMLLPLLASARTEPTTNPGGLAVHSSGSGGVGGAEAEASRLRNGLVQLVDGLSSPPFFPFATFAGRCPVSLSLARALDGAVIQATVALALAASRPLGTLPGRGAAVSSTKGAQEGGKDSPSKNDSGESDDDIDNELDDDEEASLGGQPSVAVAARRVVTFLADSLESDPSAGPGNTTSSSSSSSGALLLRTASDVLLAARARGGSSAQGEPRLVLELQSGRPLSREAKQRRKQLLKKKRRRAVVAARQAEAAEGATEGSEDHHTGGSSESSTSSLGAYVSVDLAPLRAAFESVFLRTCAARVAVTEGPSAAVKCAPLSARAARRAAAAAVGLAQLTHCAVVLLDAELERDVVVAAPSESAVPSSPGARKGSKRHRASPELLSAPARRWCGALPAALTELAAASLADAPPSTSSSGVSVDKVPGQSEGGMSSAVVALRGLRLLTTLCRRCSLEADNDVANADADDDENSSSGDSRAAQAAAMLTQLGPALVPFFARVWPALATTTSPTTPSEPHVLWTAGLHLLAALADAGALDLGSCPTSDDGSGDSSGSIGDALDGGALLFLPPTRLRWALEALHHGRRHHTPSALLGRLLQLADAACASAEDAIDASASSHQGTKSTQQQLGQPWSIVAALDERLVEISRALQLAGGAKLLRGTSPNLCAWLGGGAATDAASGLQEMEEEEDMTSAFGAAWLRPRAALLLLRGAAAPSLAHSTCCPVPELPEPLQSVAAEAMVRLAATVLRVTSTSEASAGSAAAESSRSQAPQAVLLAPLHTCLDAADSFALLKPFLEASASHLRLLRSAAFDEGAGSDEKTAQRLKQRAAAAAALISTLQAVARDAARRPAAERPIDHKATWKALATAAEETTTDTSLARVGREFVSDVSLFFG